jgi:nitrous oxide reductase accessory protein NosL
MRKKRTLFYAMVTLLFICFSVVVGFTGDIPPVKPSPTEKCPVCGMFVAKYPDWIGEIIFTDGTTVFFDGAKDLFKYYFNIGKYHPEKSKEDIAAVYVTEYYDLVLIDAYKALFVIGSDVYGPMGRELIPFRDEAGAAEFMKDHKAKKIIKFKDVTVELVRSLD